MVRHTWLTLLLMALFAFSQGASDGATERPRVLMDRSHEWTFVQDDLNRMFMDLGAHVYMCDAALDTRVRLDGVDVACIMQWDTQVDFTDEETALLTTFVRNGGALLLIGQDATPVSKVAFAFGLPFRRGEAAGPLQVGGSLQELGASSSIPVSGEITNVLLPPPSADVLVSGGNGAPLCATLRYGAGRVVCLSVCNFRWDWRTDAPAKDAVAACTKAILASLLPQQRPAGRGETHAVRGECELHLGNLHVYYPASIANASGALIEQMPRAIAAIQHLNRTGLVLTYPRQEVNLNASWAGGWSGGYALGVQALGRLEANLGVLGYELTHSYHGPLPYLLAEAYASYVSDHKLLRTLGLCKDPRPFDEVIFEQYQALDPDGIWHDFATYDPQTQRNANEHALNMRLRWLCAVLERRYGDDFMCRFIEIIRALHPDTKPTMQECLYYLSLASGEDLTPWLRSVGVTVMPVTPVEPGYLNARLADRRRDYLTLDEAPEGLRYSDLSPQLSGDDWRADWRVSDNLCPAEAQWIADASDPPAAWSRDLLALQLPPDELPRLGLVEQSRNDLSHVVASRALGAAIRKVERASEITLTAEQRQTLQQITRDPGSVQVVSGIAGKTTLLEAARYAWEHEGLRVAGACIAAKAARGLEEGSGIQSSTVAWIMRSLDRNSHRRRRQAAPPMVPDPDQAIVTAKRRQPIHVPPARHMACWRAPWFNSASPTIGGNDS